MNHYDYTVPARARVDGISALNEAVSAVTGGFESGISSPIRRNSFHVSDSRPQIVVRYPHPFNNIENLVFGSNICDSGNSILYLYPVFADASKHFQKEVKRQIRN